MKGEALKNTDDNSNLPELKHQKFILIKSISDNILPKNILNNTYINIYRNNYFHSIMPMGQIIAGLHIVPYADRSILREDTVLLLCNHNSVTEVSILLIKIQIKVLSLVLHDILLKSQNLINRYLHYLCNNCETQSYISVL